MNKKQQTNKSNILDSDSIFTRLMEKEMKKINANIEFAYYPGNHFTVATPEYRKAEDLWLE